LSTSKERRGPAKETPGHGNKKRRLCEKYCKKRTKDKKVNEKAREKSTKLFKLETSFMQ
jgi:hypothetical protein